jgi:glucan 1,3-beta-glucosidase
MPLGILIAIAAVIIAIIGATIGALIAKDVIHVGSKSKDTNSELDTASVTGGTSATATSTATDSSTVSSSPKPTACTKSKDIPSDAKDTWMDTTSWLDMKDFNCTFTDETIGGLPVVGLNSTWDDSKRANADAPPLDETWDYTSRPIRGVNIGGWLSLEPFITPTIFDSNPGSVDEYTLTATLGSKAAETLEKHYSTFITEEDFKNIAAAGLDHVRIPYSYWAIKTYDKDPYVLGVSWRYLLRGIEWARKYGLRVNLDLHAVPGSQNGWNHSGRLGNVNWILGTNGAENAQRSLDLHKQLATFFAQPRYQNVVAFYGLVNEPSSTIEQDALISWTGQAIDIVRGAGMNATQIFSEGMRGLPAWAGKLPGYGKELALDVHQYTLFYDKLVALKHADRISFACKSYKDSIATSITAFGPTMAGEWSQADTDCTKYLNGVNTGARWTGTFNESTGPECPTLDSQCSCDLANADPSTYTAEYKLFLQTFAEANMSAFEASWGWFYWTWKTESAPQWSYQAALEGGFMPALAYQRDWDCSQAIPSFGNLPEFY